jgi:hypothetical protein
MFRRDDGARPAARLGQQFWALKIIMPPLA